jgi:hypothetical protein
MDQTKLPLEPRRLRVPSDASKMIFEPMVRLAQTVHLSCTNTSTISKWTERASTWASSTRSTIGCVQNDFWAYGTFGANRAPILHQLLHHLRTDRFEIPHDPCHLEVPSHAGLSLWYVRCKPCSYLASRLALSPNGPNELPCEPCQLGVLSGVSKMISEPLEHLRQTVHLSYTISERTDARFHMTQVT